VLAPIVEMKEGNGTGMDLVAAGLTIVGEEAMPILHFAV